MYLKLIILLILITIIIILTKSKKENFNISKDNRIKLNNLIKDYNNNETVTTFNNIQVINKFMKNNVELKDIIINIKYPIGCYYIQYPENNTNLQADSTNNVSDRDSALPPSKSPEVLFGGKWQEKFIGESIFFRTGGDLSSDSRLNGIQTHAMKNLEGIIKVNKDAYGNDSRDIFNIEDDKEKITMLREDKVSTQSNKYGYGSYLIPIIKVDEYLFEPSLQSPVSNLELRVRNRIIKVWKRVG